MCVYVLLYLLVGELERRESIIEEIVEIGIFNYFKILLNKDSNFIIGIYVF